MKQLLRSAIAVFVLTLVSATAMAQFAVKGKVVDETKEGVPGVNILVKGTQQGCVTNLDGEYSIQVPNKSSILVFSFIGYTTQEINVKGRPVVNVTLGENTEVMNEVVVVGYGTQRKGDLTGALTTFKPDEIGATQSISVNSMLEGKVAGLVVSTANTAPGAASSITIRGANSLRGDNQPLYVIDNVPQASTGEFAGSAVDGDFVIAQDPLSALNPADIEDITILKDASATAIYGSRGANGVILITTKKGKAGRVKVQASANFTIANVTNLHKMLSLEDYAKYQNQGITSEHTIEGVGTFSDARFHFGKHGEVYYASNGPTYNPEDKSTYSLIKGRNWQDDIYQTALSQQYQLSLSGGTDKVTYYVSAAYKNIEGTTKNTGLKQGDLRATIHGELSKNLSLDLTMSGSLRQNDMMSGGNTNNGPSSAVSRMAISGQPFVYPGVTTGESKTTIESWLTDYVDVTNSKNFKGSLDLKWKIVKGLTYNLRLGGNISMDDRKRWYGMEIFQGQLEGGLLDLSTLEKKNYTVENVLNYNTQIGDWSRLDVTAGVTYDQYKFLNNVTKGKSFPFLGLRENGLNVAESTTHYAPTQNDYQLMSYLGRINYTLFDKYLLTFSLRADGSSRFRKGNRWGYFPSGSLAWRVNDENFLKDVAWLSQLKARVSYGVTGNQNIPPNLTGLLFWIDGRYSYSDANGGIVKVVVPKGDVMANPDLTWEQTSSWNVGVDFGFWKNRLNGNIDFYAKKTKNLLLRRDLAGSTGYNCAYYNSGSLTNTGVEVTLEGIVFDSKDLSWSLRGNLGLNRSKICDLGAEIEPSEYGNLGKHVGYYGNKLAADVFGVGHVFLEGMAPGLFFGYKTQGIIQEKDVRVDDDGITKWISYVGKDGKVAEYMASKDHGSQRAGDVKYVDTNGDGKISKEDCEIIGDPNPGFTYGFGTTLRYKGVQLSMSFNGVHGRDILNLNRRYYATPSDAAGNARGNITYDTYNNIWSPTNPTGTAPARTYAVANEVNDRYVEDGSYLRCSDITLTWNMPKSWMKKISFTNISLYGTIKNAFCITDYSGYDPEVNSFAFLGTCPGVDLNSYPNSRQFILGVNITY